MRILAINLFALVVLFAGMIYLDRYQKSLIQAELEALSLRAVILARSIGTFAVKRERDDDLTLAPDTVHLMVRRSFAAGPDRVRVFDRNGMQIADSESLSGRGGTVQVYRLSPPSMLPRLAETFYNRAMALLFLRGELPPYFDTPIRPEIKKALQGQPVRIAEVTESGALMLTAVVPIATYKHVLGALLLSFEGTRIDANLRLVRTEILGFFAIVFAVTIALSLYLAGSITRPIQRLAAAAERVRTGRNRQHSIPDLSGRRDEIGDLVKAMREMTENLWARMDETERFAADVAHEIKNPLTSVRSAVETAIRIDDPVQRNRLFAIILDDVNRMDRLINDIADASRLDSELSREIATRVDIDGVISALREAYIATGRIEPGQLTYTGIDGRAELVVRGHENHLVQVFRNLIDNAISFTPPQGCVAISVAISDDMVLVTIDDDGVGMPAGKLEAIFDRFYSERPADEKFGTHSGLGLSISRQIIEAHNGRIWGENRLSEDATVQGARFVVKLPLDAAGNR